MYCVRRKSRSTSADSCQIISLAAVKSILLLLLIILDAKKQKCYKFFTDKNIIKNNFEN
jgi:hypothetical protein